MRPRGPDAGARRAALQREDRLAARQPARDARERAWVAEGLEVEDDELGLVVVLPPLEQIVGRDVRLVADGHEGGDPQARRLRPLEQREPERAALRGEADLARREAPRREGRVEVNGGRGDAEAVRAEETGAVLTDEREQALLPLRALVTRFGEARRDDDERADAGGERILCRREHLLARHADDGEVDRLLDLRHRPLAVDPRDGVALPVHGVHGAGEVAGEDVAEQLAPDRAATLRRAHHRDGARPEERLERGPHGHVVAFGHVVAIGIGGRDCEPDLELAAFAGAGDREAGVAEHVEHRVVLVQDLRDELLDPGPRCPGRELLEQARSDSAPLNVVADREGDLRGARVAQPDPVGDGHDAAVERAEQRTPFLPVRLDERLDQSRPERRKAVEAEIAAVLGQIREELEQRVGVLRGRRSEPQRRPVAEDDVGRLDRPRHRGGQAAATCSTDCACGRTTSTGQGAEWTSPVETLPDRNRLAALQPCEPTTISCTS